MTALTPVVVRPAATARKARAALARVLMAIIVVILSVLFLLPILALVITAFREGSPTQPGSWTLQPFITTLTTPGTWTVVLNSLILALLSSGTGVTLGGFLAWVSTRTTSPLRRFMTPSIAALLFLPTLFYGLGWVMLTRGTNAPLQQLAAFFGIEGGIPATGWVPMVLSIVGVITPVAYMFTLGPIQKLDGALDDAARVSGSSKWQALRRVTIPLMGPTLLGVFVLMTSFSFSAFDLPLLFGTPSGISVFSTAVYATYSSGVGTPNYSGASSLSLLLIVLVTVLVLVRNKLLAGRNFATVTGKGYRPEPRDYGRVQYVFTGIFILVVLLVGVLPLVQMIIGSFQPYFGSSAAWSTVNYVEILTTRSTWATITTTIWLAALGGLIAVSLSTLLAYVALKRGSAFRGFTALISWAPASVPGVVIGLGLISAYLPIPGLRNLFGTIWFLLIGFVVVIVPIASRSIEGNVAQISAELEDAARVSGASPITTFLRIAFPLLLPSFLAGWFLGGLVIAGDLGLPVLLSSVSMKPVAVAAYQEYTQGNIAGAAAMFLLLMAILCALALVIGLTTLVARRLILLRRLRDATT